jgi:hypothetical protein
MFALTFVQILASAQCESAQEGIDELTHNNLPKSLAAVVLHRLALARGFARTNEKGEKEEKKKRHSKTADDVANFLLRSAEIPEHKYSTPSHFPRSKSMSEKKQTEW